METTKEKIAKLEHEAYALEKEQESHEQKTLVEKMRNVLREIEWSDSVCSKRCWRVNKIYHTDELHCPLCEQSRSCGHISDCELKELLGD
jgi:hypothetical protein